ncbi:MAG: VWA domain-containing protein [Phycisphaeraceae bacterium]|nr:VWA domain-containing protein [Phycisphaeraceae bacterium]
MTLAYPYALLLLALLPLIGWAASRARRPELAPLPGANSLPAFGTSFRIVLRWVPMALRLFALGAIVLAVARPQASTGWTTTSTEGLAIQIVYDRSGSMGEPIGDGGESKNEVARQALIDFVKGDGKGLRGRAGDMIGLIAFARYADTISPLARVHEPLIDSAKLLKPVENRAEDGTGIGDALALAAARLKRAEEEVSREKPGEGGKPDFQIKSKIIVLMTDGQNNAGDVSPYDAAKLAKEWGIRIYTIGVGAGERIVTVDTPFGRRQMSRGNDVDERMLREISRETGGEYFAAGDPKALEEAYGAIDQLEKSRIDTKEHSRKIEWFAPLAVAAVTLLGLELLAANTVFRRIG